MVSLAWLFNAKCSGRCCDRVPHEAPSADDTVPTFAAGGLGDERRPPQQVAIAAIDSVQAHVTEAEEAADAAWARLLAEYDAHKSAWEGMELAMGGGAQPAAAVMRFQAAVAGVRSKLDFASSVRAVDPDYATQALEALLEVCGGGGGSAFLKPSLVTSIQDSARAEAVACARRGLLERLVEECSGGDDGPFREKLGAAPCGPQSISAPDEAMPGDIEAV